MMSYDKYERVCRHLKGGHQRITYKLKKKIIPYGLPIVISGRVDHAAQIHFLNSLPMTSKVEKKGDSDDDMYDMLENMQAM